jgi:hypothetical protein
MNAEYLREITVRSTVVSDGRNIRFAKPSGSNVGSAQLPFLENLVSHVVGVRAEPKVCRIAAGRRVAAVQHLRPIWDHPNGALVSEPMGLNYFAVDAQSAIALPSRRTSPQPATAIRLRMEEAHETDHGCGIEHHDAAPTMTRMQAPMMPAASMLSST